MPTYEYACRSCGEHLEVVQSFKDAPLGECPRCKGELRKVFSPIGIAFKGSGFYKNDSRKSGMAASKDGKDAKTDSTTTTSSTGSSDASGSPTSTTSSGSSSSSGSTSSEGSATAAAAS